ncbi:PQ-loop repeat-containing protein ASCRUDRAFT_73733 [Ascoidea rubescens DSM 1968]|uniref:PQ-loop-domain-containing protein n=1 Tax=Ascoidea rubescens DSM 1968 TaxID=1344418 RepID=A0A1D2VQY8_9ASCO|nr:hypothetical protein ASCRUDRAFT_73733 [Ascoidea rubescens DSM 1968]ODV64010.1 hypothetical protein ASCRUDRAFT_73733 [Ascoidea rubescens DSM 1968]
MSISASSTWSIFSTDQELDFGSNISSGSLSKFFTVLSILSFFTAQFPQQLKIYKLKKADYLSPYFILIWLLGDFSNFIGCILTHQLKNQIYLSFYGVCNDLIMASLFIYYSYFYPRVAQNKITYNHIILNNDSSNKNKILPNIVALSLAVSKANAAPINYNRADSNNITAINYGLYISWLVPFFYIGSRIPQLYKNFKRKSTKHISPLLFLCSLSGNTNLALSILTSNQFLKSPEKFQKVLFLKKEMPFLIGCFGCIILDLFYFYQKWLYSHQAQNQQYNETTPLLKQI